MATGMALNTAWAKRAFSLYRTSLMNQLRKEVSMPVESHWAMQNFYFGVDYSGNATNKTFNDTPAVDVNVVKVNGVSITGTGAAGNEWGPGGSNVSAADVNVIKVNGVTVGGTGAAGNTWGPA